MQFGHKTIAVLVIALGGVIAGAYTLGRSAGNPGTAQSAPVGAKAMGGAPEAAPAANIQAPAGHPPVAEGGAPPTEGKVQIDPAAKFVHFRVGNRNVKVKRNGSTWSVAAPAGTPVSVARKGARDRWGNFNGDPLKLR